MRAQTKNKLMALAFMYCSALFGQQSLLAPVKNDSVWGYINTDGKIIVPMKFIEAGLFHEGLAAVATRYLDSTNSWTIKYGYIDKTGREIIKPKYERAKDFSKGMAAVYDGQWKYINKKGEEVIKERNLKGINGINYFCNFTDGGGFIVTTDATDRPRVYSIDKTGKKIKKLGSYFIDDQVHLWSCASGDPLVISLRSYDERFFKKAPCPKDTAHYPYVFSVGDAIPYYGFCRTKTDTVVPAECLAVSDFCEGIAYVYKFTGGAFIDPKGKTLFDFNDAFLSNFCHGRAAFVREGKIGFIDKAGKIAIPPVYSQAGDFQPAD